MSTTQATAQATLAEQVRAAQPTPTEPPKNMLDYIVENTEARKAVEAALGDEMTAKRYAKGAGLDNSDATYIIALGRDLGLNAPQSLQAIDLIGGRPALRAQFKAAFLIQAGYSWKVVQHDDTVSKYRFYLRGEALTDANDKPLDFAYTMEEATKAGYVEKGRGSKGEKVGNYDKFPKNMLFARMIANFHRFHAPHVMGATMAEVGELIDAAVAETEARMARESESRMAQGSGSLREKLAAVVEAEK